MRTYDEIKGSLMRFYSEKKYAIMFKIKAGGAENWMYNALKDYESYIDNIDEVTIHWIGCEVNSLIRRIQYTSERDAGEYYVNFEKQLKKYGCLDPSFIDVKLDELIPYFKGKNPTLNENADSFRKFANANLGTNIPMASEVEQAELDWKKLRHSEDTVARDKAFVHFKEVQRDSGALVNGGTVYLLATNQAYQDAKARCSGKHI